MAYTPQATSSLDAFNRTDGALETGAGGTIWDTVKWGGGSANWQVFTNQAGPAASGAGQQSLFTLPADKEIVYDITAVGADYLALFFDIQDDSNAHWLIIVNGVGWDLKKMVAGSASTLASASGGGPTLADVQKVSIYHVNGVLRVRYMTSDAWVEVPLIEVSSTALGSTGKVGVEANGTWRIDNLLGDAATEESGGGGGDGPFAAVTLWVDADHAGATDDQAREDVTEVAPCATLQGAALLAMAGLEEDGTTQWADTIKVKGASNADVMNALDTAVYAPMHHLWLGGDILPFGDNTGNAPIRVQAVQGDDPANEWDKLPKVIQPQGQFKNWIFESASAPDTPAPSFQAGYDVGSGNDVLTCGSLRKVAELRFRGFLFTGGGYEIKVWDDLLFEGCWTRAPYSSFQGDGNRFLDGVGFHLSYIDNNDGQIGVGAFRYTGGTLDTIFGEDAFQIAGGGVGAQDDFDYSGMSAEIDHNLFMNVVGVPNKAHTDSIQILGGTSYYIHDNVFLGCDDCLIASDFHNGTIRFENNLCSGCGLPLQGQGTDLWVIRHNTFVGSFFRQSVALGERTEGVVQRVIMVNNVLEDYAIAIADENLADDSVIQPNIVLYAPGINGNLAGVAELGTSARLDDLPTSVPARPSLPANYELANSPISSAGIGQGVALDASNGGTLANDRLGRAYASPPDVGCHQSDPGTTVTPAPRPPYVLDMSPIGGGVGQDTTPSADLYAVPGQTIDGTTVTATSAYVTDAEGNVLDAVVTLGTPDEDGRQLLSIDIKASLDPVVEGSLLRGNDYTVHLTGDIGDTEGSTIAAVSWSFKIALGGKAVSQGVLAYMSGGFLRDGSSGALVVSPL